MNHFVSIIIVNWNGRRWLTDCLDSLSQQTHQNFEIVLVDNASKDDSIEFVEKNYPQVIVIRNHANLGFASGNNAALGTIKGDLVLLLNNDTRAPADYLEKFVRAFDEIPNLGAVQSKIVLLGTPDRLDSCGSFWTRTTILYHYGVGKEQSLEKYNKPFPVFTNKGASMLIRRDLIDKIGLFDDDFWCYYEETDFCHRVWLAGYECWYYPKAVIFHAMGGTSLDVDNSYIQFHNYKNKLLSLLKNIQWRSLVTIVPIHLSSDILISIVWLLGMKFKHFSIIYKAIWWNLAHLRETLEKRRTIQSMRKISDKQIFLRVQKNPKFAYYIFLFRGNLADYEEGE
jgi:GT2 family glycosyltransferase